MYQVKASSTARRRLTLIRLVLGLGLIGLHQPIDIDPTRRYALEQDVGLHQGVGEPVPASAEQY